MLLPSARKANSYLLHQPVSAFRSGLGLIESGPPRHVKVIRWTVLLTEIVAKVHLQTSFSGLVLLLLASRALHSDILDFGCRVAVTEQKLYLSGASAIIGDLKSPTSVAGPVRIGRPEGARGGVRVLLQGSVVNRLQQPRKTGSHLKFWTLLSRQTCAKHATCLTEAIRGSCTADLPQSG